MDGVLGWVRGPQIGSHVPLVPLDVGLGEVLEREDRFVDRDQGG